MKNFHLFYTLTILTSTLIKVTESFCPDDQYLHPFEEAGYACYKEDEGIICDSNNDPLCDQNNCEIQLGGFDAYNCAVASYHYDNLGYGSDLLEYWVPKCCYAQSPDVAGCLGGDSLTTLTFNGECNFDSFYNTASNYGCQEFEILAYLQVPDLDAAASVVEEMCLNATAYAHNSFYNFADIAHAGYQFDREFMNGGSDWINSFNPDMSRIQWVEDNVKKGISFPTYLHNFNTERSCDSQAVMCCWTADATDAGSGSCKDPNGCQDAEPDDNADVCYVDVKDSAKASHTETGVINFAKDSEGNVNCKGFTWTDDDSDLNNLYKGNLLFEVAMRYGLKGNGYVRSVPHAPMCACVEQMPVVSRADCTDVSVVDNWSFSPDSETGLINLWQSAVDFTYGDCSGHDLATHYEAVHSKTISDKLVGDCAQPLTKFEAENGKVESEQDEVLWVKVAGKGAYAEPDNVLHTDVRLEGTRTHSSMSSEDFRELWKKSKGILLRRCKYCNASHRYIYYKSYHPTDAVPENVDILKIVKEYWHFFEGHQKGEDWDLYSTYDNALNNAYPWAWCNGNDKNVGLPRDCGPYSKINNQWNTWDVPVNNRHYGQSNVAFYVAMSPDSDLATL